MRMGDRCGRETMAERRSGTAHDPMAKTKQTYCPRASCRVRPLRRAVRLRYTQWKPDHCRATLARTIYGCL